MTRPTTEPIEVSLVTPPVLRWGLGLFGAAIAFVATHELIGAIWPISIFTPFFGLMFSVALFGGGGLLLGSIVGPDETWTIDPGRLTIRKSLRNYRSLRQYNPADFDRISVETSEWDSRPTTYCLHIRLLTGALLKSPEFGTVAKAQAAADMLVHPA